METITDAVSVHSIKKAEYAKKLAEGKFGHVTLLDHFISVGRILSLPKFYLSSCRRTATHHLQNLPELRRILQNLSQVRSFAVFIRILRKLAIGYSIVTYLLQIKDRHNGNILLDRDGHLVHIDFGFMLSNTPGNIGFEAAPFKLPPEYVEVLGGVNGTAFLEFKALFRQGFEVARKHCDRIISTLCQPRCVPNLPVLISLPVLVELMQKGWLQSCRTSMRLQLTSIDSTLPCFAASGDQTATQLRDRFQPTLTHSLIGDYVNKLIDSSLGSHWTRLYDSVSAQISRNAY